MRIARVLAGLIALHVGYPNTSAQRLRGVHTSLFGGALSLLLLCAVCALTPRAHAQCGSEWVSADNQPTPLTAESMVYDSVRHEVVMFGGSWGGASGMTWIWNGRNWRLAADTGPVERSSAAMAFDPVRGRTTLFGGLRNAVPLGDTWEWDGEHWTQVAATGPAARARAAMAYDNNRGRIVLFGGMVENNIGDTWEWDGVSWTMAATSGPSPRSLHAMTTDPTTGSVLLFGGQDASGAQADLWRWNGTSWLRLMTQGPAARYGHAMVTDSGRSRVVLTGGADASVFDDAWEWDGTAWIPADSDGLGPRYRHAMAYDAVHRSIILFAGQNSLAPSYLDDTLISEGAGWTRVGSYRPPAQMGAATVFDPVHQCTVLFGEGWRDDTGGRTFLRAGTRWIDATPETPGPLATQGASLAWDGVNQRVLLFGGFNESYSAETWTWDGVSWTQIPEFGPLARALGAMAYDPVHQYVLLFGGVLSGHLSDTWEWDGSHWTFLRQGGPPPLIEPKMIFDPVVNRPRLFGTASSGAQMWTWDGANWVLDQYISAPLETAVYDESRDVFVTTGFTQAMEGQTWEWDRAGWRQVDVGSFVLPRNPSLFYDPVRATTQLFGGELARIVRDNTWEYRPTLAPRFVTTPGDVSTCPSQFVTLSIDAVTRPQDTIQWRRDGQPIAGANDTVVVIAPPTAGSFDCVISGPCGEASSPPAEVSVCGADQNCDSVVNSQDFFDFLAAFFANAASADFNSDATINSQDFFDFLAAFFAAC